LKCRDLKNECETVLEKVLVPIIEKPLVEKTEKMSRKQLETTAELILRRQEPCLIKIRIIEDKWHLNHPINQAIRLINQFSIEAFLK
jgi:hypothetical protein